MKTLGFKFPAAWMLGALLFLLLPLAIATPARAADGEVDLSYPYAIQLMLTDKPIEAKDVPNLPLFENHRLYVTSYTREGKTWYRLRMGFFESAKEAAALKDDLEKSFPGNWVTRVSVKERKKSAKNLLTEQTRKRGLFAKLFGRDKPDAAETTVAEIDLSAPFALQLMLSKKPVTDKDVPRTAQMKGYRVYVAPVDRGGITWYQVRMGFFKTAEAAATLQAALEKQFPGNWVVSTSDAERAASAKGALWQPAPAQPEAETPATVAVSAPPVPAVRPVVSKVDLSNAYVLQLMLSDQPIDRATVPLLPEELRGYRLYVAESTRDNKRRYQLRLGFFATAREAAQYQQKLEKLFPGNWVTRVSVSERRASLRTQIVQAPTEALAPVQRKNLRTLSPEEEKRLIRLMDEGRKAVTRGDYSRAIQIYTGVLEIPDHIYQQDALEFLGLARERNGQLAHAKAEYERYLALYPEGAGATRVRQRLAGLVTATKSPKEKLKRSDRADAKVAWNFNGGVSQYYRYDVDVDQAGNSDVLESSISTDLDLNLRRRGGSYNLRSRFSGDHRYDFLNENSASELRVTTMYLDASQRGGPWSGRVGRQTQTSGGVLGRYDGFTAGYRLAPKRQINLVAGFPVDISNAEQITTGKHFIGLNADLGTYAEAWDFNFFVIDQRSEGIVDRQAAGAEVRYFRSNRSLFGLYDYDFYFDKTNTILLLGNLILPDKSTLNLMVDVRKSPVLTTTNGIQGQPVTTVDQLVALVGKDTAKDLALARTPTSRTVTFGGSHPFNDRVQINTDLTISRLGGTPDTPASGSVAAVPAVARSAQEYFFNTQFIINRLLRDDDITILGARYTSTTTARGLSLLFNTRYPAGTRWRLNPRARLDFRDNFTDQSKYVALFPSFRADYRIGRRIQLEMEAGADWTNNFFNGNTETTYGYYVTFGYRASF